MDQIPDSFDTEVHSAASPSAAYCISLSLLISRLVVYSVLKITTLSYGLVLNFLHMNFIFLVYLKLIGPNKWNRVTKYTKIYIEIRVSTY